MSKTLPFINTTKEYDRDSDKTEKKTKMSINHSRRAKFTYFSNLSMYNNDRHASYFFE